MTALEKLKAWRDPEYPEGLPPVEPDVTHSATDVTSDTEWVTWTGTYYPTLDTVPWQSRGSAVEVPARR